MSTKYSQIPSATANGRKTSAPDNRVNSDALTTRPIVGASANAESLTKLISGAHDALDRDLSIDELTRIVAAGPLAEKSLSSTAVQDWLALLEFEYVEPLAYQSAWAAFVDQRLDSGVRLPSWLPLWLQTDFYEVVGDAANEGLSEAGWMWIVADPDEAHVYDSEAIDDDESGTEGVHGFVFRQGSTREAVIRHRHTTDDAVIDYLAEHPASEIARGAQNSS